MADRLDIYSPLALAVTLSVALAGSGAGRAQTASGDAPKPKPNKYGTPLDTIRNTRLWTDVPPAQDFVKATRPDVKGLTYTPLTGVDPARPKPRDPANVQALQAEMERFGVENEAKAKGLRGGQGASPSAKSRRRTAASAAGSPAR